MTNTERATVRSVAAEAGVSVATVSYVLRGVDKRIPPDTQSRVRAIAEKQGYQPNRAAQAMRTGRNGLVALSLRMLSDPWSLSTADAVGDAAQVKGLNAVILTGRQWWEGVEAMRPDVAYVDGLTNDPLEAERVEKLVASGQRLVIFSHTALEPAGFDVVHSDPGSTMRELADVVTRHTRDVAFLIPASYRESEPERFSGYAEAVRDGVIAADRTYVYDGSRLSAFRTALTILREDNRPRAIMCNTDYAALAVIQAAHLLGIEVPRDLVVTGFGDSTEAELAIPSLTTAGPEDFHRKQAEIIVDAATSRRALGETHRLPWIVQERDSTQNGQELPA